MKWSLLDCTAKSGRSACISSTRPKTRLPSTLLRNYEQPLPECLCKRARSNNMTNKTSKTIHSTKVERARQYLSGGGVTREDSDDELGLEDHPWQWIHSNDRQGKSGEPGIMGVRMGNFQCMIGDCVLLKAEGAGEAWIGLICGFQDDHEEDEKAANFMWFSTEREIRNKQKKRTDALPVHRGQISV